MSDNKFTYLMVGLAITFIGAIFIFGSDNASSTPFIGDPLVRQTGEAKTETNDAGEEVPVTELNDAGEEVPVAVQPADHYRGEGNKGVTLIEYADFECPACLGFHATLLQIEQIYGDDITVIFRHNPLPQLHLNAVAAHRASEAAANQGKFWEMHDLLYENQNSWSRQVAGLTTVEATKVFETYAVRLELDMDKYREDVVSAELFSFIDSHIESGAALGVTGTPTIFLNGEEVPYRTLEEMQSAIDELIFQNEEETPADDQSTEASN